MTVSRIAAPSVDRLAPWQFAAFVEANTHDTAYRPPVVDGPVGPTVVRNGRELVNFASISFLELDRHLPVQRYFAEGARARPEHQWIQDDPGDLPSAPSTRRHDRPPHRQGASHQLRHRAARQYRVRPDRKSVV